MNFKLITTDKKFSSFFWTQFLGAFNDNFFKNALVVIVTFKGLKLLGIESSSLVALAGALFILPFFLFSPIAGQLSDKLEKSRLVRITKQLEVVIMLVAAVGFFLKAYALLLFVLFLMGFQSALFGPVKYSLIPQLVDKKSLVEGNALIELGTFLAILLGTIGGGLITNWPAADYAIGAVLVAIACTGYFVSCGVPYAKAGDENLKMNWNPFKEYSSLWGIISEKKVIFNSVLAISWFWFFGAGILSVLPVYVKETLNGNEAIVTLFLSMFTIGVGIGSVLCEKLSFKKVEIGLVPIGSIGMTLFLLDLYFVGSPWVGQSDVIGFKAFISSWAGLRLLFDFIMMSVFGGIFIVPLYTLLQERSDAGKRSRVIAANNIFNAFMMVMSSLLILALYAYKFSPVEVLAVFAGLNAIIAIYIYTVVPEFTLRFYSWVLSHIVYSIKTTGEDHIPSEGAFILAANHVSYVDWLILSGACKRPVSFVMYYKFFKVPIVKTLMKQSKVIPIASAKEDPDILKKAFDSVSDKLKEGDPVCIFPEGTITRNGELSPLKPGIIKMIEKDPVPVVPVVIHGLWGSIFSRKENKDRIHRRRIMIEFLKPIKPTELKLSQLENLLVDKNK